jgi:hypothetical protein
MVNKVVVKYLDGRMVKGSTLDFSPTKDTFHVNVVETNEKEGRLGMREVELSQLKAIFFVKDFAGRPDYKERTEFLPGDEKRGKKIRIVFADGEKLSALSMGYARERKGFFVNPVDPESNNIRIFIISSTVKSIESVP